MVWPFLLEMERQAHRNGAWHRRVRDVRQGDHQCVLLEFEAVPCCCWRRWRCRRAAIPKHEKLKHLERGNQYAAEKRDEFAVVEYASAVQIDPKFGEARLKLAETYERMGNLKAAFPEYVRAADALPDNREAQLKAIRVLLLARQFDDAKARVAVLLAKNPKDVEALLLHANAMVGLRDPAGAIAEIEEALKVDPEQQPAHWSTWAPFGWGAAMPRKPRPHSAAPSRWRRIRSTPNSPWRTSCGRPNGPRKRKPPSRKRLRRSRRTRSPIACWRCST